MASVAAEQAWDELTLTEAEYKRAASRYRNRRSLRAVGFVAPYLLPWLLFLVVPTFWSIGLGFFEGGILGPAKFVGFRNWREIGADHELTTSMYNTFLYVLEAVSLAFVLAIGLALLLNRYRKGSNFFKLALYFPLLAPAVLVGLIWQFLTNFDFGFVNLALDAVDLPRQNILGTAQLALLTIVLAEVWRGLGFWTLYYLAGLQNIPEELLDAARVDGAKGWRRFARITVPMMRPMFLFAVVVAIIANFQVFDTVYVLTQGGPHLSTSTIVWFIWKKMFLFQETGQAYAASILLLLIILVLTAVSFRLLGARRRRAA
jgi:ABC-type sugar transport system permease subunit